MKREISVSKIYDAPVCLLVKGYSHKNPLVLGHKGQTYSVTGGDEQIGFQENGYYTISLTLPKEGDAPLQGQGALELVSGKCKSPAITFSGADAKQ